MKTRAEIEKELNDMMKEQEFRINQSDVDLSHPIALARIEGCIEVLEWVLGLD